MIDDTNAGDAAGRQADAGAAENAGEANAARATVSVRLVRSIAGTRASHRATVRGLGLRRLNSVSTLEDTPAVRGMIDKVSYLVKVL